MTSEQERKCHVIIHTHSAACGAGNLVPVPGVGVAADLVAMTTMAVTLAAVFGGNITEEAAKGMAVAALKRTVLKQPLKVIGKELAKLIPFAGQAVSATAAVALCEAAGWALANDMDRKFNS
jgi:uncharacterized protein (DUF697 family)